MTKSKYKQHELSVFDTDMQIHRLGLDPNVSKSANSLMQNNRPSAICSFSLVELKGNYIQKLILLKSKTETSNTLREAFARADNSGGRGSKLMLAQLVYLLDIHNLYSEWKTIKNILITHIDAQIDIAWEEFRQTVDTILDSTSCTRATEDPEEYDGHWTARIKRCNKYNCNCNIETFFKNNIHNIKAIIQYIGTLDKSLVTDELKKIHDVAKEYITTGSFSHDKIRCRNIGDLIISLESIGCKTFISSNYKEHTHLCKALSTNYLLFDTPTIRIK